MPLPGWLGRFNRRVTNRGARLFAGRVPRFAVVVHVGRRSGRRYRTPVNLFRSGEAYVIALTYGADRDWVRNVMAAGRCAVETRGTVVHLQEPRIVTDPSMRRVPPAIRPILRAARIDRFLLLSPADRTTDGPAR